MSSKQYKRKGNEIPLLATAEPAVKDLFIRGENFERLLQKPLVGIVGTRRPTPYGTHVTQKLAEALARAGVGIVSGLALGVDSLAHTAAVEAAKPTIAVLPASVNEICPRTHIPLAKKILEHGGALVSEYPDGTPPLRPNFIARNRIVAALSSVLLIPEAAEKSGSLHTARFALEQGKTVAVVPGPITSSMSTSTNNLLKSGAVPITDAKDILDLLGLGAQTQLRVLGDNAEEQRMLDLLYEGLQDGSQLLKASGLSAGEFNQTLTMLEITGKIRALGANQWAIS